MTDAEINRAIAEKVMQDDLSLPIELVISRLGSHQTAMIGGLWHFRDGTTMPMPPGKCLPQPEGSDDWNYRYYFHAGKWLLAHDNEGKYAAWIREHSKREPRAYATDISQAFEVVEAMFKNHNSVISMVQSEEGVWLVQLRKIGGGSFLAVAARGLKELPRTICLAALKAVDHD